MPKKKKKVNLLTKLFSNRNGRTTMKFSMMQKIAQILKFAAIRYHSGLYIYKFVVHISWSWSFAWKNKVETTYLSKVSDLFDLVPIFSSAQLREQHHSSRLRIEEESAWTNIEGKTETRSKERRSQQFLGENTSPSNTKIHQTSSWVND